MDEVPKRGELILKGPCKGAHRILESSPVESRGLLWVYFISLTPKSPVREPLLDLGPCGDTRPLRTDS